MAHKSRLWLFRWLSCTIMKLIKDSWGAYDLYEVWM
jgi:hypothetical protein